MILEEPQQALAGLRLASDALVEDLTGRTSQDDMWHRGPSLLPDWDRATVVAHLIGNADSVTAGLQGALEGRIDPCYPGGMAQRDGDIEARRQGPIADLIIELISAHRRLDDTLGRMTPQAWQGSCSARGQEVPVCLLPWRRWREIEVHRADLGFPTFTTADWSPELARFEIGEFLAETGAMPAAIAARTDRQQMAWILDRPASDLTASWTARTLDPGWVRPWSEVEIGQLDDALTVFRSVSPDLDLATMSTDVFPLPGWASTLTDLRRDLVEGSGVAAFTGFPVAGRPVEELRALWWGLSLHLGTPVAQSRRGDVIGDVRDLGTGINGKAGRGYTSNSELNFHADACDVSGLFFLKTSAEGGVSRVASSVVNHDRIARRRPDLLELLYQPMPVSWQSNQPDGEQPWYDMPVFGQVDGQVSCAYVRTNITLAHQNTGSRVLTAAEREAVQLVVDTAAEPDLWVERRFEPGTMLFLHSHTTFHLRTQFTDHADPDLKRHLLRVWLSLPNNRRLPGSFGAFFGSVDPRAVRGGYPSSAPEPVFRTV